MSETAKKEEDEKKAAAGTEAKEAAGTEAKAKEAAKEANPVDSDEAMEAFFSDDISESVAKEVESEGQVDENMYATSLNHENVKNGIYKSRIRFIKNPFNTKDNVCNILHKYMYFLPHPDRADGRLVLDCTSNFGERSNIITEAFFFLKGTKQPALERMAKQTFSRKGYYFSLVKIISDAQQEDMVDKIKVFRFASQVNEKINSISEDDESVGVKGTNFSHPFDGKDFIVDVRMETFKDERTNAERELTSYNKSKFVDDTSIVAIPDYPKEKIGKTKEYMVDLYNWMKENSPNLHDYSAKKWTPEQEDLAIRAVRMVIEDDAIFNKIYRKTYGKSYKFNDENAISNDGSGGTNGMTIEEEDMIKEETSPEQEEKVEAKEEKVEAKKEEKATSKDEKVEAKDNDGGDDIPDEEDF